MTKAKYARMDEFERDLQEKLKAAAATYEQSYAGCYGREWCRDRREHSAFDTGYFTAVRDIHAQFLRHKAEMLGAEIQETVDDIFGEKPTEEVEEMILEERMERDINLTGMEHTQTTAESKPNPITAIAVMQKEIDEIKISLDGLTKKLSPILTPEPSVDQPQPNDTKDPEFRSPLMAKLNDMQMALVVLHDCVIVLLRRIEL